MNTYLNILDVTSQLVVNTHITYAFEIHKLIFYLKSFQYTRIL